MQTKNDLLLSQMIENQKKLLLRLAKAICPRVTEDDLLQPFDFKELESSPHFRYEEGVLHGFQAVKAALLAEEKS